MTNNTLFTLKEGELLNYSDIHTHSSHLKDSQCFLFKDNKQNRSEAWMWSEDAEKPPKSQRNKWKVLIYMLCICSGFQRWFDPPAYKMHKCAVQSSHVLLATFHIRRWRAGGWREVGPPPSVIVTTKTAIWKQSSMFFSPWLNGVCS